VRNFQPNLEVGRESVLEDVDNMRERLHLLARHNDGVGKHLVGRASAWADLATDRTMQTRASREGENCVEKRRHGSTFSTTFFTNRLGVFPLMKEL
jgi:hypothetical protein